MRCNTNLSLRLHFFDERLHRFEHATVSCWYVMIHSSQCVFWSPSLSACSPKSFKCLGAGNFVNQVTINVQQRRSIGLFVDYMIVPDFIEKSFGAAACSSHARIAQRAQTS